MINIYIYIYIYIHIHQDDLHQASGARLENRDVLLGAAQ